MGLIAATIAVISMASGLGHPREGALLFFAICPAVWIQMALQVKRWHDRDKSGWWVLIGVIPIVGRLYALVETGLLRGTEGPNRYGPDPTQA